MKNNRRTKLSITDHNADVPNGSADAVILAIEKNIVDFTFAT